MATKAPLTKFRLDILAIAFPGPSPDTLACIVCGDSSRCCKRRDSSAASQGLARGQRDGCLASCSPVPYCGFFHRHLTLLVGSVLLSGIHPERWSRSQNRGIFLAVGSRSRKRILWQAVVRSLLPAPDRAWVRGVLGTDYLRIRAAAPPAQALP